MVAFRSFEALTFDCYGTLIDWESGLLPILQRWAKRNNASLRGEKLLEVFAETEARVESEHPSMLYPDVLAAALASMAEQAGTPRDFAAQVELAGSVGDWPAFADTIEALRSLKRRYQLGVLTNVDRASFEKSNRSLGVKFDLVLTAQDVGSYKPKLTNFHALLNRLYRKRESKEIVCCMSPRACITIMCPQRSWDSRRFGLIAGKAR